MGRPDAGGKPALRIDFAATGVCAVTGRLPQHPATNNSSQNQAHCRANASICTKLAACDLPYTQLLCISAVRSNEIALLTNIDRCENGPVHTISSIEDARALVDVEVGVSDWVLVDQERIDSFAEATGDRQWIHVDVERAAQELPNGKTIAHGYLTLSLIPALTDDFVHFENLERAINFGSNKTRFYAMVPEGARVRARATVKEARKRAGALHLRSEITVEVEGERKPACVTETIGMYFFK